MVGKSVVMVCSSRIRLRKCVQVCAKVMMSRAGRCAMTSSAISWGNCRRMGSAGMAHMLCWATEIRQRRFEWGREDGMVIAWMSLNWGGLGKGGGEQSLMRSCLGGSDRMVRVLQRSSLGRGEPVYAFRTARVVGGGPLAVDVVSIQFCV
jgi:hypothetical protein